MKIPAKVRPLHFYIAGMTGYGKSTLIHAMAYQDIKAGRGVCVIDPKGDLVNQLIHWIPDERKDDAIYIDLDTPIPIDFMGFKPLKTEKCSSEISFSIFEQMESAVRAKSIVRDLVYTLTDAKNTSFLDIYYFLVNKTRRDLILSRVKDPDLKTRWLCLPRCRAQAPGPSPNLLWKARKEF